MNPQNFLVEDEALLQLPELLEQELLKNTADREKITAILYQRLKRERLIRRVVELANQSLDLTAILITIAREVGEFFELDRAYVSHLLPVEDKYDVNLYSQYRRSEEIPAYDPAMVPHWLNDLFTRNRSSDSLMNIRQISNPEEYAASLKDFVEEQDIPPEEKASLYQELLVLNLEKQKNRALLRIPIIYRGNPYGAIILQQCTHDRQWTHEEISLLQEIATQVGIIFYQTDISQKEKEAKTALQKSLEREHLIRKVVETIGQSFDIDLILKTVIEELGRYLQVDRGSISRYTIMDEGKLMVNASAQYHAANIRPTEQDDLEFILKALEHLTPDILRAGDVQVLNISDQDKYLEYLRERLNQLNLPNLPTEKVIDLVLKYEVKASLRVNIDYRGIPYGTMNVSQVNYSRQWQADEVALMKIIAEHAGAAIYQADLYRQEQLARQEEKRARQEAEEANRKKSEFLAMMSHELRTPLNAILGYSRMIENGMGGALNELQRKYIHNVCMSGNHLLTIVNDLLDISKVEAGKMHISMNRFEINEIIQDVKAMMTELAAKQNVMLFFDLPASIGQIEADPYRFKQILINLISNAIKFNKAHGQVWVRLHKAEDEQWLVGEIEDTGIGIPAEKCSELFKKFYQVDTSASRMHEGTGLGLALTKELIELHGGKIYAQSTPNIGSIFTFRLPIHPLPAIIAAEGFGCVR